MNEELISFETAKLAKEKNYCNGAHETFLVLDEGKGEIKERYYNIEEDAEFENMNEYSEFTKNEYERPTQSLLQRWLREIHEININILIGNFENYFFEIFICKNTSNTVIRSQKWYRFKTYEEALEIGLQESLKLIKDE